MNRKTTLSLLLLIFCFGCIKDKEKETNFQSVLESIYQEHQDALGIMIHVEAPNQSISWSGAIGYSNWEKTDSIQADQPALIASITKNYVAVSILRLIEQEKLGLYQNLEQVLSKKTAELMKQHGFDLNAITIAHLLSHKSGIPGYTQSDLFIERLKNNPMYRWTRDEQIKLAIVQGVNEPPGTRFIYTDTNYLLLAEIIEQTTGKDFNVAIKELIGYEKFGLNETWFYSLESVPKFGKTYLIHQYVPGNNEDSYKIDNSFDLYGGGGIAATTKDLCKYAYHVFNGDVFENKETLDLMFTDIKAKEGDSFEDYIGEIPCEYYLGIQECGFDELNSYWHSGYWGTIFRYFPDLEASIAIYVVNEAEFANIELDLMKQITTILK